MLEEGDDKLQWPTVTDLNTRLRRVITSYQRSYRKEEQKLAAAKAKVCFSVLLLFSCVLCADDCWLYWKVYVALLVF